MPRTLMKRPGRELLPGAVIRSAAWMRSVCCVAILCATMGCNGDGAGAEDGVDSSGGTGTGGGDPGGTGDGGGAGGQIFDGGMAWQGEGADPGDSGDPNHPDDQGSLFIAPEGDDVNDGRALDRPVRTFARASALAVPGDIVQVRGGIYTEFVLITSSGTEQDPIIYEPYNGEAVIIDGSAIPADATHPDPWNWTPKLFSIRASHVIVRGFEARNSPNDIFFLSGHHITLDGVHAHDGYLGGIRLSDTYSSRILNSTVHDIFDIYQGGENSDCIASAGGERTHHNIYRGNLVYGCGDDGIDTWNTNYNLVAGNVAHHCGRGPEGDGNGFKLGGAGGGNNVVRFNVAYMNRAIGFTTNTGANDLLYNNTAFHNGGVAFQASLYANTLLNNIAVPASVDLTGPAVSMNNSWDLGLWGRSTADFAFKSVDSGSSNFLRLSSTSHAIDQGIRVKGMAYTGAAPDLGAFEYSP